MNVLYESDESFTKLTIFLIMLLPSLVFFFFFVFVVFGLSKNINKEFCGVC